MSDIKIDWNKVAGLIPAIIQDSVTGDVLMLGYMNEEALDLSLKTGYAHFFSRTKNRIWKKGEESGHTQKILSIKLDCDNDTLLLKVEQNGVACHTGFKTCFFTEIFNPDDVVKTDEISKPNYNVLDELYHIVLDRKLKGNDSDSYVASLFKKGENAILKKVGEEASELIMAIKDATASKIRKDSLNDLLLSNIIPDKEDSDLEENLDISSDIDDFDARWNFITLFAEGVCEVIKEREAEGKLRDSIVYEAADLLFHMIVALSIHNIHPDCILSELKRRFGLSGIEEKNSRDK